MFSSPCLECDVHLKGMDKNGPECGGCRKRIEYVGALDGENEPIPVEMTDMGAKRISPELAARVEQDLAKCAPPEKPPNLVRWTHDQDEMALHLAPTEAAERLGRSISAIHQRRHALKILGRRASAPRPAGPAPGPTYHPFEPCTCPHCGKGIRFQVVGT